jgi:hypothetical protein
MKRKIYKAIIAAATSALFFGASAPIIVKVGLPLISRVESSSMLAGSYTLHFAQSGLIWIDRTDGRAKVVALPVINSGKPSRQPNSVATDASQSSLSEPLQVEHEDQRPSTVKTREKN